LNPSNQRAFDLCLRRITDLAVDLTTLESTLASVFPLFYDESIRAHDFECIRSLLHASAKGPPDVGYLLLAIAVGFHSKGVTIRCSIAQDYTKFLIKLLHDRVSFVTFGKAQSKAKRNLIQFARLFSRQPAPPLPDIDHDHWGIDIILAYLRLNEFIPWTFGPVIEYEPTFATQSDVGSDLMADVTEETDEMLMRLVALFTSWDTAYDATKEVWRVIQSGEPVAVDALVRHLPVAFADFLCAGLQLLHEASKCGVEVAL
jgi:hypothetical protein